MDQLRKNLIEVITVYPHKGSLVKMYTCHVVVGIHLQSFMDFKLRIHISSNPRHMVLCSLKEDPTFNSPHHVLIQNKLQVLHSPRKNPSIKLLTILGCGMCL